MSIKGGVIFKSLYTISHFFFITYKLPSYTFPTSGSFQSKLCVHVIFNGKYVDLSLFCIPLILLFQHLISRLRCNHFTVINLVRQKQQSSQLGICMHMSVTSYLVNTCFNEIAHRSCDTHNWHISYLVQDLNGQKVTNTFVNVSQILQQPMTQRQESRFAGTFITIINKHIHCDIYQLNLRQAR